MQPQTKAFVFSPAKISTLVVFGLFVGIVPMFVHSQWLTGPFINALLLLACVLVGPMEAVILGLLPSTVALSSGLLPLPLAPMIPFIMISNAILIATFYYFSKVNFTLGVIIGATLKYVFLYAIVTFLATLLLSATLLPKVAFMMSWPQFATALLGGLIAFLILRFFKKTKSN